MTDKRAPVQRLNVRIPWDMHLRAYDAYAKRWGPQLAMIDLEGRGCRGGFSYDEIDEFIPGWREELCERDGLTLREERKWGQMHLVATPVSA